MDSPGDLVTPTTKNMCIPWWTTRAPPGAPLGAPCYNLLYSLNKNFVNLFVRKLPQAENSPPNESQVDSRAENQTWG